MTGAGTRTDPFRMLHPERGEELKRSRDYIGVTGTVFPGDEATVTLVTPKGDWDMDVEYAKAIVAALAEVIRYGQRHNRGLGLHMDGSNA